MTNKQIIIDGVDVSRCIHYKGTGKRNTCGYHCKLMHTCYYKQLKQSDQIAVEHRKYQAELEDKLTAKEQECKEKDKGIKFLLEKLDLSNNRRQDCEIHWEKERKELKQQLKVKEQECDGLKETLKVIANRPCLNINDCNGNCLPHCKWNAHKLAQEALKELE